MPTHEVFYVVIIICIIVLAAVACCLGLRILRRQTGRPSSGPGRSPEEWQPLGTVASDPVDNDTQEQFRRVSLWQSKHPPDTVTYMPVNPSVIAERGLDAWTFVENEHIEDDEEESNVAVMDRTTLAFCHGKGCALTNLPLPINQEFVYWEVKVLELGSEDRLAIGLTTKPYPVWRLPGWHRHSVAYHSHNGAVYISDSFVGRPYGPPFKQGDVVGVGFLTRTSTVFFTRNGKNLGKASIGFKFPVYPAVGATGPCQVSVNLGQQEYLFSAANVREAALAPTQGVLPPPPAYGGHERDTLWFEPDGAHSANLAYSQPQPPSYS